MQNVLVAYVPKKLRGSPSEPIALKQAAKNLDNDDMEFTVLSEPFNEYVVDKKFIMKLKTNLVQVMRSRNRNMNGEPIYLINSSVSMKLRPKKG